jgi:hypothetical protein
MRVVGCLDGEVRRVDHDLTDGTITAAGTAQFRERTPCRRLIKGFPTADRGRTIRRVASAGRGANVRKGSRAALGTGYQAYDFHH